MDMITLAMAKAYTNTQRLGYAETERVNVMELLTLTLQFGQFTAPSNIELFQAGKSYAVKWNGVEYICIAQKIEQEGVTAIGVGDLTMVGGTGNGEPFFVLKTPEAIVVMDFLSTGVEKTKAQLAIDEINEIIHTIDPKFIPGPKVIDLTKYLTPDHEVDSFNGALMRLFFNGGGFIDLPDSTTFWQDVNTSRPLQLAIDGTAIGYLVFADVNCRTKDLTGVLLILVATAVVYTENGPARATIIFSKLDGVTEIELKVEPFV